MSSHKKLRVVLCALTGFGNPVLASLMKDPRVEVAAVFTVKYKNPFPHYEEKHLDLVCEELGIPCYYGIRLASEEGICLVRSFSPDLMLVATFKQILTENVLQIPSLGVINFHPSLLPYYRGACPTNAALLNDESVTGVTVHYVTEGVDEGDVLLQRSVPIGSSEIDGQLRKKLASLAGEMVPELIELCEDHTKPVGKPQNHKLASFAPKPSVEEGHLETAGDVRLAVRKLRAFNPLPGTSILVGDKRIDVDRFEHIESIQRDGIYEFGDYVDLVINSEALRLHKKAARNN